ncbi:MULTISPECIES: PepSY domain-containing protein [Virgibacillus]|uniref:Peptidase propeptide and YPEB domain protein n=1 Tax=Virgibacillus dokdonensis TaxID=302167 RepID=A0A2K9J089_9BACI|nr:MULTISPECIES: PepSY domain-containing protein [Virgibacillus]AUJ25095.1 Peptidase propeptide and YPEB domain protein [Virgibacillus dokdonensis]NWO14460.1 PepSY domain-containing protein [Virgibacillus sp.]
MKKKLGIIIGTIAGAAILGTGVYYSNADEATPKLDGDKIKSMVQEQYDGQITEFELETDRHKAVYEVEVTNKNVEYDLELDGDSGEVLKENKKEINQTKNGNSEQAQINAVKEELISMEEAKSIAKKQFDGKVMSMELDEDDNQFIYEIELRNGKKEAEFEIHAENGEILKQEIEIEDDHDY